MRDANGIEYLKLADAKVDTLVRLDDGFTCTTDSYVRLRSDERGLYFACSEGKHYIDGQADDGIHCIGIYPQSSG